METQLMKISEVIPNEDNPRYIREENFKKLVKSIKEFPEMLKLRPIVINEDNVALGGNMRLKACLEAGLKEVPVIKVEDLTPKQQKEFIIKDNVGFGEWNWDIIANEWDSELLEDWGLNVIGFDDDDEEDDKDLFADEGIEGKNQYGVIVMCESEGNQESVFKDLTGMGFECKIVVT